MISSFWFFGVDEVEVAVLKEPWKEFSVFLTKESIRGSTSVASLDYEVVEDAQHTKLSRRDFSQTMMTQGKLSIAAFYTRTRSLEQLGCQARLLLKVRYVLLV